MSATASVQLVELTAGHHRIIVGRATADPLSIETMAAEIYQPRNALPHWRIGTSTLGPELPKAWKPRPSESVVVPDRCCASASEA
jgi:hypothetical protein